MRKLLGIITLLLLLGTLSGCSHLGNNSPILTNRDIIYFVPKGSEVIVYDLKDTKKVTKLVMDMDMALVDKGYLLAKEVEWNKKAILGAREAKKEGLAWGGISIGALITLLGGIFKGVSAFMKKKKAKKANKCK